MANCCTVNCNWTNLFSFQSLIRGAFTLLTSRFLNSRFFVSPFTLAQKTPNLAQVRNFAIFWIGTAHARPFHIFSFDRECLQLRVCVCVHACECLCACVSVCVCVHVMCVLCHLCVCLRAVCVCITQMSSFSKFDIIVLNWGAYKCVCVCVCLTRASSLIESNIIVLHWGCLQLRVCLTQMSSFSKCNIIVLDWGACSCVCV